MRSTADSFWAVGDFISHFSPSIKISGDFAFLISFVGRNSTTYPAFANAWAVLNDIAKKSVDKPIFLCGGGANEKDIIALCDKVIWLKTDEKTIRERVNIPRDHTYGTKPHELAAAIEGNLQKEKEFAQHGAIMIDARRPLDEVVQDILGTMV